MATGDKGVRLDGLKAVHDRIAGRVTGLEQNKKPVTVPGTGYFELGSYNTSSGKPIETQYSTRIRTKAALPNDFIRVTCPTGYTMMLFGYSGTTASSTYFMGRFSAGEAWTNTTNWATSFDLTKAWNTPATGTETLPQMLLIHFRKGDNEAVDLARDAAVITFTRNVPYYPTAAEVVAAGQAASDHADAVAADLEARTDKDLGYISAKTRNLFTAGFKAHTNLNTDTGAYSESTTGNNNTTTHEAFIPVTAGSTYAFNGYSGAITWFYWYAADGSYISKTQYSPAAAPETAAYLRMKLQKDSATEDMAAAGSYQLELGTQSTAYVPPRTVTIANGAVGTALLADGAVTEEKTAYIRPTRNLFRGSYAEYSNLDTSTGAYKTGNTNTNTVACEYYIPVQPGGTYTYSDACPVADRRVDWYEYGSGKSFIRLQSGKTTIQAGENTHYVRMKLYSSGNTVRLAMTEKMQVEAGGGASTYVAPMMIDPSLYERGDAVTLAHRAQALSDANAKETAIRTALMNDLYSGASRSTEATMYGELLAGTRTVADRHLADKHELVRFALITDCHRGGKRSGTYLPDYNIAAMIELANSRADFVVNCGDMITNYFHETKMTGLSDAEDEEQDMHDLFQDLTVPYYLCKGNHDLGISKISIMDPQPIAWADGMYALDPDLDTFYRLTEEAFDAYVQGGGEVYKDSGITYFDNDEIQEICLDGYCDDAHFNELDPDGWYYYFDVAKAGSSVLRCVVLNDFYRLANGHGRSPYEAEWLAGVLADAHVAGLPVVTFSHTAGGLTNASVLQLIKAFVAGGGVYVGHIHGHEHADVYTNSTGFNNIGCHDSIIKKANRFVPAGYAFDFIEIDLTDRLIREIRTGHYRDYGNSTKNPNRYRSEDRLFSYDTPELLS